MRKEQTAALIEPSVHGHVILLSGVKHFRWWCGWHLDSTLWSDWGIYASSMDHVTCR
jgi:hypothetical protein